MRTPTLPAVRLSAFIVAAVALVACAATPKDTATTTAARRDNSIMDSTELRGHNYSTVYDAISALHSDWLLARGGPTANQTPAVGVFVDGSRRARDVSYLRELRPSDVKLVRRLAPTESLHTYSWPWGAIVITSR